MPIKIKVTKQVYNESNECPKFIFNRTTQLIFHMLSLKQIKKIQKHVKVVLTHFI